MTKIESPGPLLLQLGAQALSLNRKERDRTGAPAPGEPDRGRSPTDIFESIAPGIARIPANLPDRRRRAFRIYLEALLARELRVEDSSAPGFQGLVDRVVSSMEADDAVRAAVERAGEMLLTRAR